MRLTFQGIKRPKAIVNLLIAASLVGLTGCQTLNLGEKSAENTAPKQETLKEDEAAKQEAEAVAREKAEAERLLEEQRRTATEAEAARQAAPKGPSLSLRPPEIEPEARIVRIAILLPLSGKYEKIGNDLLKAAYMAVFDQQNKQLRLQPYDTLGTADGASGAAIKALQEGAEIIVGPLFSDAVKATREAVAGRVNVVAFSTDITAAGNGVYLLGLTPQQQIQRVMNFAYRQGLSKFAVIAPETPYGDTAVASLMDTTKRLGVLLTDVTRYPAQLPPGSDELHAIAKDIANYEPRAWQLRQAIKKVEARGDKASKAELARLKKLDTLGEVSFEALVIPEGGQRLRELAPLLSYYDVDPRKVKYIGTGLWADSSLASEPALIGGWFAAPSPEPSRQFLARFQSTYGYNPPRISSLAYDALALTGLLAQSPEEQKFTKEMLEDPDGFAGYNGIFRFLPSGLAERGLAVMTIGQEDLEVLEPAPTSFTPLIN